MKKHKRSKKFFVFANDRLKSLVKNKYPSCHKLYAKYAYILHLIIHASTMKKDNYKKYGKRLNVDRYRKLFGSKDITQITKDLINWGYIKLHKRCIPGQHARTYKLTSCYEKAPLTMLHFKPSESKFIKDLLAEEKKECKEKLLKNMLHIYEQHLTLSGAGLQYFRVRYPHCNMERLLEMYQKGDHDQIQEEFNELMDSISIQMEDMALFSILLKEFYVITPGSGQRVYSNICHLKREKRQFLLLQGQPLLETDIACSQVVFSIPVIAQVMERETADFNAYKKAALSGTFYNMVAEAVGQNITDTNARKQFKKQFFAQVFFSKPNKYTPPIKAAFKQLFPNVLLAINQIKARNYKKFALDLQELESQTINYDVLKTLQEEGHLALSLHDAIYVHNSASLQRAKELVQQSFSVNYGLKIGFKTNH